MSELELEVWQERTFYDLLEVRRSATSEDIQRAYKLQMQAWSPDKFPQSFREAVTPRAQAINEAYQCLNNPAKRARYDRSLPPEEEVADAFGEPIQNVAVVWKRLAAWMKDEDVGTSFLRQMAFKAGDILERHRAPSDKQRPYMVQAWDLAIKEGFDPQEDDLGNND